MSNPTNLSDYTDYIVSVTNGFNYYFLVVVSPLGVFFNLLSIFIFIRPSLNKNTNTGFLFNWLCILNLINILYFTFVFQANNLFNYTITFPCGVRMLIRRTTYNVVSWMQVFISFDRFFAVIYPRAMFMRKRVTLNLVLKSHSI